jgi:hypothetical protein
MGAHASPSRRDGGTLPCPVCGQRFTPHGRQRVCSAACRQAAWRRRQPRAPVVPAALRTPRPATIYECPTCGTRALGEQRCTDCGLFGRRIGPGGRCPHCGEPVAVADLID